MKEVASEQKFKNQALHGGLSSMGVRADNKMMNALVSRKAV